MLAEITETRNEGVGRCVLAAVMLCCSGACTQKPPIAPISIPAAKVAFSIPGDWEQSGEKPMDAQHVCYPKLTDSAKKESIEVLTPPKSPGRSLETIAQDYVSVMRKVSGSDKCDIAAFSSGHLLKGFNIRYFGTYPDSSGVMKTFRNSVYIFLNQQGDPVFVMYVAMNDFFSPEVDNALRESLVLSDK